MPKKDSWDKPYIPKEEDKPEKPIPPSEPVSPQPPSKPKDEPVITGAIQI